MRRCVRAPQVAFRGLFIVDGRGIVRHVQINDLPVGRSVDEVLRLVKAFQVRRGRVRVGSSRTCTARSAPRAGRPARIR